MKGERTSTIALVIAGILLLGVGAYSYHDYVKSKLEKEFSARFEKEKALDQERELLQAQTQKMRDSSGQVNGAATPQLPAGALPPPVAQSMGENPPQVPGTSQMPDVPLPPIPPQLLTIPPASGGAAAKGPEDERLAKLEADLAAMKKENELYQRTLEKRAGGNSGGAVPGTATEAVPPGTPGAGATDAATQAELAAIREKVRTAAAIAKVVEYDPDWAFVVIDRGKDSKIETGMHFAVRRGAEILGFIKITEVEDTSAVAQLQTRNKFSPTARKPAPGDDIIAANQF